MTTFVFDADGVVCIAPSFGAALEKEHGIPADRLKTFFRGPFPECIVGRRDLKVELAPYLSEWGWKGSVDELLRFWFRSEHVICPAVLACVHQLRQRGHHCVLGTNQESYRAAYLRTAMGLGQVFDQVFASCEIGAAKPSPDFFTEVEAQLPPGRTLCLVDDSEKNVLAAQAMGWSAIWYRTTADIPRIFEQTR